MRRIRIEFTRIESLEILEALALENAKLYKRMKELEIILKEEHSEKDITRQIEQKRIDNTLMLMLIASIEKRFVAGFMQSNFVELGLSEIEIIEGGLNLMYNPSIVLKRKLSKAKNIIKLTESNADYPVIYDSEVDIIEVSIEKN